MTRQEIFDVVCQLNDKITDAYYHLHEEGKVEDDEWAETFSVSECCGDVGVEYCGTIIWTSDNDYRAYIDEEEDIREDLQDYLLKLARRYCTVQALVMELIEEEIL